jgi:hypothetical protein
LIRFVLIVVLVAGAVVGLGLWHNSAPSTAPTPPADSPPSAETSPGRPSNPAPSTRRSPPPKPINLLRLPVATGEAEEPEIVPWLNPLPPLLALGLSSESPAVRAHAEKLNRWLKLTVDLAIKPCWARRPPKHIWAEFSAELEPGEGQNSVAVNQLRFVRIHGDYSLSPEEAGCISENLGAIKGRSGSEEEMKALGPHLPMSHRFAVERR